MDRFGVRLRAAVARRGPLCVGVDPHPGLLRQWGLSDDPDGLAAFARTVVDALADRISSFKPQSAFFERFGSRGIADLEILLRDLRASGALVLFDEKCRVISLIIDAYANALAIQD